MVLVRAHHRPHHGSIVRYRSPAMQTTSHARVIRQVRGAATSDGAGVKLTRVIGGPALPELAPFLLLDEFGTDQAGAYIAGFPRHPHRGFETVTYMLDGRMPHKDNNGNTTTWVPGTGQESGGE